jgi:site-specific recombinase XerD
MLLNDLVLLFLDSRRRGVTGAKKKCSPATMHIYEDNMRVFTNWLGETHGILHYGGLRRVHLAWFLDFLDKKVADGHWKVPTELQILRTLKTFFRWIDADEECQEAQLKGMQKYLPAIRRNPRRTDIPGIKDVKTYKSSFNLRSPWEYRDYVV